MSAHQGASPSHLLTLLEQSAVTLLDRWKVNFSPLVKGPPSPSPVLLTPVLLFPLKSSLACKGTLFLFPTRVACNYVLDKFGLLIVSSWCVRVQPVQQKQTLKHSAGHGEDSGTSSAASPPLDRAASLTTKGVTTKAMNNYMGIGIDAKVLYFSTVLFNRGVRILFPLSSLRLHQIVYCLLILRSRRDVRGGVYRWPLSSTTLGNSIRSGFTHNSATSSGEPMASPALHCPFPLLWFVPLPHASPAQGMT